MAFCLHVPGVTKESPSFFVMSVARNLFITRHFFPRTSPIFARLVKERGLSEKIQTESREPIAGRLALFHEVIARGLASLSNESGKSSCYWGG